MITDGITTLAMVDLRSDQYGEEYSRIPLGQGMYTSELASNIPDGFSPKAFNLVATGDSLENRSGIRLPSVTFDAVHGTYVDSNLDLTFHSTLSDSATLVWCTEASPARIAFLRAAGGVVGGDGYMEIPFGNPPIGVTSYGNFIYYSIADGNRIYKITALNWATDSITSATIPSAAAMPELYNIFAFKDRIWAINGDRLYYTNIAALGGLPETWVTTNYIPVRGHKGGSRIVQVVPLGNKLIIFTETGSYTLMVQGEPASWILRVLDITSNSTKPRNAFESKGIVYYVNTNGVWGTNGSSIAKLSGPIEDQFFLAKGFRKHSLCSYEDGMILSITKLFDDGKIDAFNSRIFYSKTDPVGWTEWNINDGEDTNTNAFGNNRIVHVQSVSDKIRSFINLDPVVYAIVGVTDSVEASHQNTRYQLVIFDGGENNLRNRAASVVTTPVSCYLKTKYMDCGNPYRNKQAKEGLLELYTSDQRHSFTTSWDMDATTGGSTEVTRTTNNNFTVGQSSNLIRVPAGFWFRRCALSLKSNLQSNTSQFKIKDFAIRLDTGRSETEVVR